MSESTVVLMEALRQFSTCDVSDALCKMGDATGGFIPGLSMWSPDRQAGDTKIVGPAFTVQYVSVEDPAPKASSHYIDSVPENSVIFVSSPSIPNAVFGGLMSTRALARGCHGAVIDGRFRDLEEQRALQFPVFARDVGTAPPYSMVKVSAFNVEVFSGETRIRPGDWVIADLNGVVVLPVESVEKVLPLMARQKEADEKMAEAIKRGSGFMEASCSMLSLRDRARRPQPTLYSTAPELSGAELQGKITKFPQPATTFLLGHPYEHKKHNDKGSPRRAPCLPEAERVILDDSEKELSALQAYSMRIKLS